MYAKVFSSLWNGSLRGQPDEQLVFIYMLAHADEDGVVDIIVDKITDDTGLSPDATTAAIKTLEEPDPNSRTPDDEGRRIIPLYEHGAWGWRIVNYKHYRELRNQYERRMQNRAAQSRYKSKQRSAQVSNGKHGSARSAQEEVEVEAEGKGRSPAPLDLASARLAAAFRPGLIEELTAQYPERDVPEIARKLLEPQRKPVKDFNRALRNWCKSAEFKDMDRRTDAAAIGEWKFR